MNLKKLQQKLQTQQLLHFRRRGAFYEACGPSAVTSAKILNLRLFANEQRCGFPSASSPRMWKTLLNAGYRIAINDEAAGHHGPYNKTITSRVLSPGCLDHADILGSRSSNYVMALGKDCMNPQALWALCADLCSGELYVESLSSVSELNLVMTLLTPSEILLAEELLSSIPRLLETFIHQTQIVMNIMQQPKQNHKTPWPPSLAGLEDPSAKKLLQAFFLHVTSQKLPINQFTKITPLFPPDRMILSPECLQELEMFQSLDGHTHSGTLWQSLNLTVTSMGERLLRIDLATPLCDLLRLEKRQDLVETFRHGKPDLLKKVQTILKRCSDLDHIRVRVATLRASTLDLKRLHGTITAARDLLTIITALHAHEFMESYPALELSFLALDFLKEYFVCSDEEPALYSIFKYDCDSELYQSIGRIQTIKKRITAYEIWIRDNIHRCDASIKDHGPHELIIEIPKPALSLVPKSMTLKKVNSKNLYYTSQYLRDLSEDYHDALAHQHDTEARICEDLQNLLRLKLHAIASIASLIAELDIIQSLAAHGTQFSGCRPRFLKSHENQKLVLQKAQHLLLTSSEQRPQSLCLKEERKVLLMTGPNNSGKTTIARNLLTCVILAQIGAFVPAVQMELPVFQRLYILTGRFDATSREGSTFIHEAQQLQSLFAASPQRRTLIMADEFLRSTDPYEAAQILDFAIHKISKYPFWYAVFITHFQNFLPTTALYDGYAMQMKYDGNPQFPFALVEGLSASSEALLNLQNLGLSLDR